MNTRFRTAFILAAVCGALTLGTVASAGTSGMVGDVAREAKEKEKSRNEGQAAPRQREQARAPQPRAPEQRAPEQRSYSRGGDGNVYRSAPRDRGNVGNLADRTVDRTLIERDRRDNRGNWNGGNTGGSWNGTHRPPRYVNTLPGGYRQYYWNGRPYYNYGGSWYRPYGSRYIVVGAPYGLFVSFLPSYYSSFWFGGTRYFYADDTYYLYEPARHGYVVARSPYASDRDDEESSDPVDDDLFIYPARGQSEQQQADDRYECHRWAAKETSYDPIDSDFDADKRADYQRAMTACLTGRGYSVK
jgi:hypothetical protein